MIERISLPAFSPLPKHWSQEKALTTHFDHMIEGEADVYVDGKIACIYRQLPDATIAPLWHVAARSPFSVHRRTGGLLSRSVVYGALPRVKMRQDYCRWTRASAEHPENAEAVRVFARDVLAPMFASLLPAEYERQCSTVTEQTLPEWRFRETPFTSCIVNCNQAMGYHRDNGNFPGLWSNLVILRRGVVGGQLVLPELRIAFAQQNGACLLFDGRAILHGVLPIKLKHPAGQRISCVWYALDQLRHCLPPEAELQRSRQSRHRTEHRKRV